MGFRYRKSIKIARGVRINLTGRGLSSVSIGKPGATLNLGARGARVTVGLPGTGLSYSASLNSAPGAGPASHSPIGGLTSLALTFLAGIAIIAGVVRSADVHPSVTGLENPAEVARVSGTTVSDHPDLGTSRKSAADASPPTSEITSATLGAVTGMASRPASAALGAKVSSVINTSPSAETDQPLSAESTPKLGAPLQIVPQTGALEDEDLSHIQKESTGLLNLNDRQDVIVVQKRLQSLGYLTGSVDGRWGRNSKAALARFRIDHQLDEIGIWDDNIQFALFSARRQPQFQVEASPPQQEIPYPETPQPRHGR